MFSENEDLWQQHFPTYKFKDKDIVKEEYISSSKLLEAEEKIFLNASNLTLIFATTLGSLVISFKEKISTMFENILSTNSILITMILLVFLFTIITLKYFADRQRSILFATRKVIILRRMLGLNYGNLQLILPNWRIEGADQPFSVKLFPGWFTYVSYPFYILSVISTLVTVILTLTLINTNKYFDEYSLDTIGLISATIIFVFYMYIYRKNLLDIHERPLYLFSKNLSSILNIKLIENFEYTIYRAKLARYEINRLEIELTNLKEILIFIEDKEFLSHSGINLKGFVRGLKRLIMLKRTIGGSSITQQLVRSLFIYDLTKVYRRKVIEILLAFWFNKVITKDEQLEIYLASVRFEKGVFGIMKAMSYFWGKTINTPSKAQSFFLIERVSNIRSSLLSNKIEKTVKSAKENNILKDEDIKELISIYEEAINNNKISASLDDLKLLEQKIL